MSKKEILVEYLSNINSVIKQSLHQTQRIKFTCFDVSINYVIFGASSGGIYIFYRNPCKFIKLIPSKEGSVTHLVISPDEKDVALSTVKGLIVVVINCLRDSNLHYQTYTEHEGNNVTAMKWYLNDIYCGDHVGQVSVISLTQLLTKALFQTPSATLMRLDSSVVQLDVHSTFLLVSTRTRTYLCDTHQEQYRQIGKKLRDGNFGACFFYKNGHLNSCMVRNEEKNLKSPKDHCCSSQNIDVKIYCARPGSRLWEVNFDSSVVCTHQFRDSLNMNPRCIIHLDEKADSSLNISTFTENISCSFNFEKIYMFNDYILTFKTDGIYIFDLTSVSLICWTNYFSNIKDIKILGNIIYIWLENNSLKILSLLDIETFIMKILSCKQYSLCAQFCLEWKDDISVLIDDNRLQALKILNEKLTDEELLNNIEPLLKKVQDSKIRTQKLQNGIYVVDNVHNREKTSSLNTIVPELSCKDEKSNGLNINDSRIKDLSATLKNDNNDIVQETDPYTNKSYLMNIIITQYQVNKVNSKIDIPKFQEIMQSTTLEELKNILNLFLDYTEGKDDSKRWIIFQILRYVSSNMVEHFKDLHLESTSLQFLMECFIFLNTSDDLCNCFFPLPSASSRVIQFYEVGCQIIEKCDSFELCKEVPSMYRFVLESKCRENLTSCLPLLTQYNDFDLFNKYYRKFTYDMWDEVIKLFVKLKCCICLNCDRHFKSKLNVSWSDLGKFMLHSIGGPGTLKLLSRYSPYIPSGELDVDFYQSCIFISCVPNNGNDIKSKHSRFLQNIEANENKNEFDSLILNYLKKKHVGDGKRASVSSFAIDLNCSICDIPLTSQMFDDNVKLKCGHCCHKICAINKDVCNTCCSDV